MKILFAKFANADCSVVELRTVEAGAVLVPLDGPDVSGGWQEVYAAWAQGNETDAYVEPIQTRSASEHLAAFGFDAIALVNLLDIQTRFAATGIPLPEKCAATRSWITAAQVAYASGQALPDAPYTLPELLNEIAPLLQP